jgi:enoyl-CoA hydratase/carnithine racemase
VTCDLPGDLLPEARKLAARIAAQPPAAVQASMLTDEHRRRLVELRSSAP